MDIDEKINSHFDSSLEKEILEYFGYERNWRYLPLTDERHTHWLVSYGEVYYQNEPISDLEEAKYSSELIGEPYRTGDYVLIAYDTHCDGNKYLGLFRADKECKVNDE